MCNENANAQMGKIDIGESLFLPYNQSLVKSSRLMNLAREMACLTEKICKLTAFLEEKDCEKIAGAKQVELMRGQLEAMENYKRFLSCRIADLALSDLKPSEKEKE
jgi:hypothetical protein